MSAHSSGSANVQDLWMEVSSSFFPPPTILLPVGELRPLRHYEYSFGREQATILHYEQDQKRKRAEERERQLLLAAAAAQQEQEQPPNNDATTPSPPPLSNSPIPIPSLKALKISEESIPSTQSAPTLMPPPFASTSTNQPPPPNTNEMVMGAHASSTPMLITAAEWSTAAGPSPSPSLPLPLSQPLPPPPPNGLRKLETGFEEFELKRDSVFDILARSCINDKAELEKLLM